MKTFLLSTAIAVLTLSVTAQNKSSISITSPEAKMAYKPASTLYTGMDNILRIESSDATVKRLWIETDNGEIHRGKSDYIIKPKNTGEVVLKIYDDSDRMNRKLLETRTMKAMNPPTIMAVINGKNGGKITKDELTKAEVIDVSCPECKDGTPFITECKISVVGKDVPYREFTIQGNTLTPELKEVFKTMGESSKFYVEYIKAKISEDSPVNRLLPPLTFVVSN